jgi:hypothetical protein
MQLSVGLKMRQHTLSACFGNRVARYWLAGAADMCRLQRHIAVYAVGLADILLTACTMLCG